MYVDVDQSKQSMVSSAQQNTIYGTLPKARNLSQNPDRRQLPQTESSHVGSLHSVLVLETQTLGLQSQDSIPKMQHHLQPPDKHPPSFSTLVFRLNFPNHLRQHVPRLHPRHRPVPRPVLLGTASCLAPSLDRRSPSVQPLRATAPHSIRGFLASSP